jgi:alpha-glucosidase
LFVPTTDGHHTSTLQEDDGLTFAALDGACYRTTFDVERAGDRVRVQASVAGRGYPEFTREQFTLVLHGAEPPTVRADGVDVAGEAGRFALPNSGTAFNLEFAT